MGTDQGETAGEKIEESASESVRKHAPDVGAAKQDLRVLYRVIRDSRSPWYVPVLVGVLVLWAISPIDALPDALPVLGVVDEAVLFLIVRGAVYRLVPDEYVTEHARRVAEKSTRRVLPRHLVAAGITVQLAVLLALFLAFGFTFVAVIERLPIAL